MPPFLVRLGRSLALLVLVLALALFATFAISPGLELLPGGLDGLLALAALILLVIWLRTGRPRAPNADDR